MALVELDYMEYATHAAAQAAYVTDAVAIIDQQQTTLDATVALGDAADVEYRNAQSFQLSGNILITAVEVFLVDKIGTPTGNWTLRIETDNGEPSGTLADANASIVVTPPGDGESVKGTFAVSFFLNASTTYWLVVNCDNQSTNNRWRISTNRNNLYANGLHMRSADGVWSSYVDGNYDLYFKIYDGISLQCFSESSIKQQGSYSLKVVATQTDSLNHTLTRTVSPTIDLSGKTVIKLDIYALRTGSQIKIGFHDSGGVTTEHTANVVQSNVNQTETIDISAVADANKDAIDTIIITIVNADAANIAYFDNIYAPEPHVTITPSTITSALVIPAPTILYDYSYQPAFLSLLAAIQTPTIIEGIGIIVSPSVITSILTILTPTITGYKKGTGLEWTVNYNSNYYRRSIALQTETNLEQYEQESGTWADFGSHFSLATNPVVASEQYFDSEEIDMGAEVVGSVQLEQHITDEVGDAEVTIYWRYGTSSPLTGDYSLFAVGDFTFRYAQLRIYLKSNSPYSGNIYLNDLILEVDVFDIVDSGASVTIAIGGTTISFNEDFQVAPAITITSQDSPLIPKITEESKDSFKCTVYDKDGNDVGGIIDWVSSGF